MTKKKPHPIHSGDIHEGDFHWHEHKHMPATENTAFQTCLKALRALHNNDERTEVIGNLIATLIHEHHIKGVTSVVSHANTLINHYQHGTLD